MKKLLLILILVFTICGTRTVLAQTDNAKTDSVISHPSRFYTELTLASRNMSRGVSFGNSPSIQMLANYRVCNYFEVGTYGQATMNGTKKGYGNTLNLYAAFKVKKFSLTFDDFFYFNSEDSTNNYFEYGSKKTQHFVEARLKYDSRLDLIAAYTVYQNSDIEKKNAIYLEAGYDLTENFNVFAGYVTDQSAQMFYDKAGFTSAGVTVSKNLNITNKFSTMLKTSLIFSPNYKNVTESQGVGRNPIYLVASLTF